ncbi:hypothetical protein B9Z55_008184 [Caenorhabditis nigoni]|uniref:Uncharacterized protein n=1 Tax=Caenorhabditis nigoni TaxID=1611254 RepID=A0A2G5VD02_9PELO|nr:hypothetical protein B9Z55_008184 [Caenorhabditis nigoni]
MDRINCYQKKDYCRFEDRESKITSNLGKTAFSSIQEQCSSERQLYHLSKNSARVWGEPTNVRSLMDRINCYQKKDYCRFKDRESKIISNSGKTALSSIQEQCSSERQLYHLSKNSARVWGEPTNVRSLMDRINCYQKKDYCRFKDRESKIISNSGKTALSSIQEQCSSVGRTHER